MWPQSTFPSEASGAKYDQRLTPTHRVPTMQPSRWQSVRSGFWECEVWWSDGRVWASALWWMQWNEVLAVFVEGFLLTFDGGVVILKVHIWEHSGPFGYLIPIWLVV